MSMVLISKEGALIFRFMSGPVINVNLVRDRPKKSWNICVDPITKPTYPRPIV